MSESPDLSGIVKTSDVRGIAGVDLTVPVARALGAAFADVLESPELIVGHDMRVSSPELARAVIEGAVLRGAIVADAGLTATDQLYCASGLHRAAGVMVTASHNPAQDNGMKLCLPGAQPISRDTGLDEIRRRAEQYLRDGEVPRRGEGRAESVDTLADYVSLLHRLVELPEGRPLRVVVDAADAMATLTAPAVLGELPGIELIELHFTLDGTFPNHPADPLRPENLRDLREAVLAEGADLGLAFDGDADRCVVLDETGEPVPPSAVTAMIAQREIARAREAGEESPTVLANLVSSRHVEEAVREAGGRFVRTPVGHSLIKALMIEHDAAFGGEHSAHYYFRDFFCADSGMLAALHVLAALRSSSAPISALAAEHSRYAASGELSAPHPDAHGALERVRSWAAGLPGARTDELDGLTVTRWADDLPPAERWWLSLRPSGTEPLLRLNVEAVEEDRMAQIRDEVLALIDPDRSTGTGEAAHAEAPIAAEVDGGRRGASLPTGASGADIPRWVRAALRCPDCRGELRDADASLRCLGCGRAHAVDGGIPVLIAGRVEPPTR